VKTADYWSVFFAVQENIKSRFDAEGISMPFPQQDVHLHHVDGPVVN
jgi:small conductance mechanosensitive channel